MFEFDAPMVRAHQQLALTLRPAPPEPDGPAPEAVAADGHVPRHAISGLEVSRSVGVAIGAGNTVQVLHQCAVEDPVVEIAELLGVGPGGPVFQWSTWGNPLWNWAGVSVGVRDRVGLTYQHKMGRCPANLAALLQDAELRAVLAAALADSDEAGLARRDLRGVIARVVAGIPSDRPVPNADLRPGGSRLTIVHGAGVPIGHAPVAEAVIGG